MKRLLIVTILAFISSYAQAGLITHTDYTSGAVITAAGQNANENAIYNEFNGNIDNTNIKTGGITSANILDGTIVFGDLNSVLQSTVTVGVNLASYKRPSLVWNASAQLMDIETGLDGTSGEAVIVFPDGSLRRDSTTSRIQLNIGQNAAFSGTAKSGLRSGSATNQTWYSIYAAKVADNAANFVIVADTVVPTAANYTALNNLYGTSGWVYLGMSRYGDTSGQFDIFTTHGGMTILRNHSTSGSVNTNVTGIMLSSATSVGVSTWTYSAGVSGASIPANILMGYVRASGSGSQGTELRYNNVNADFINVCAHATGVGCSVTALVALETGLQAASSSGSSIPLDLFLTGWVDGALGGPAVGLQ